MVLSVVFIVIGVLTLLFHLYLEAGIVTPDLFESVLLLYAIWDTCQWIPNDFKIKDLF